ncbi:cellulose synthase/poly-beta-1,6-N-acetylglucosamine synthase-like glycosyltransferase [Dyadobacter sp. BE34]|uniref:Cellulose synthase/poly-beta-1,6-N-acetylglucosamine synthase-like glycosyltransferase n=1 Tax=Dyadobacter fermentans TaxID=94254 RepID=A0ABU1QYA2_9BACT|nr:MULTISPECIES: glycosyltransferase [Dyadobacter]MDR6806141.1 cellulose synthase/poly-beta-1,6-N-acetylglucosamine synthase-like glycosyltransferase [Dyadobacter fermentans]MDR7043882.1 cellulose synthase/poly-beta-1,6-N-acetylglucosamine synthase-like glycosyltransferase [Dyadobacter sp. BE242]MDR7198193.1 cellulose synthase/poly-beta-1,6-N-acetylglucosamine synthase-like glycosyltransferase [Dyadobacter sp. BE34]MDR7216156.1 cellulose synthase/poly-beta-1,6-N-acetylglucosamine synthase-like 
MKILEWIGLAIQAAIGYNLVFPVFLLLIYGLRKVVTSRRPATGGGLPDYGIIVTAYEYTAQLPAVVGSLLQLNYDRYHVYVVADKCDISNLRFPTDKVLLLRPEEVLGSNTRSHFYAIRRFVRPHTHLTIIDSDNLTDPQYLNELNVYFNRGYEAVQGVREAKNLDTTYACLDAARDIYYHFYDGKVLFGAGSSATLAGSGMAFSTALYEKVLGQLDVTGAGFDKVLQEGIVSRGYRIAFAEKAIVYDEKTTGSDQLVKQRARWINTWFKYFAYGFKILFKGIARFSLNQVLFGLVLLRPPLFIFLLLSVFFMLLNLLIAPVLSLVWLIGLVVFVLGFYISLKSSPTDPKIYQSLVNIPKFMFYQLTALVNARRANKISVATRQEDKTQG